MRPFHQVKVLSINKEKAIRTAYQKALAHPGAVAWVAEHGGNYDTGVGGISGGRYKKQIIFAACLIENGEVCRWHYVGFTMSNPTDVHVIAQEAGFGGVDSYLSNFREKYLQDLKDFLIVHSEKFMDRMPLYINHKREDIRIKAREMLSGKQV